MSSFKTKAMRTFAMVVAAVAVFAMLPVTAAEANGDKNCNEKPGCYFGNGIDEVKGIKIEDGDTGYMRICYFSACGNPTRMKVRTTGPLKAKIMPKGWHPGDDVMMFGDDDGPDGGNGGPGGYTECAYIEIQTRDDRTGDGRLIFEIEDRRNKKRHRCTLPVWVKKCVEAPRAWASTYEVHVEPGEHVQVDICAAPICSKRQGKNRKWNPIRLEMIGRPPFIDPIGHIQSEGKRRERGRRGKDKNGMMERDRGELCLWIDQPAGYATFGTYWAKFRATDLKTHESYEFKIKMVLKEPSCDGPKAWFDISGPAMLAAGASGEIAFGTEADCDGTVTAALGANTPPFCTLAEDMENPGNFVITCNPSEGDVGKYEICVDVTEDLGDGSEPKVTSVCINAEVVGMADMVCTETEGDGPTTLSAGDCVSAANALFFGDLGAGNDVDTFTIDGLDPFTSYEVLIAGGMNFDGQLLDTTMGCFSNGVLEHADDNSGPMPGYSKLEIQSDANGSCTIAVSGKGDMDFDGLIDGSGLEHGRIGAYVIMIPNANPERINGDIDGDGDRDADDLMLLADMLEKDFKIKISER